MVCDLVIENEMLSEVRLSGVESGHRQVGELGRRLGYVSECAIGRALEMEIPCKAIVRASTSRDIVRCALVNCERIDEHAVR